MKIYGKIIIVITAVAALGLLSGCSNGSENTTTQEQTTYMNTENAVFYEQITPEQAKRLMDENQDCVIIDARTQEEFAEGHIEGAIMIPEYDIKNKAEAQIPQKDKLILVYCRSGRRSKIASQALAELGYTNVKEFGGIIDWPYETVK